MRASELCKTALVLGARVSLAVAHTQAKTGNQQAMSRNNSTYKESYNRALDLIHKIGPAGDLPTEAALSIELDVSRTTVRGILGGLDNAGIIEWSGRSKRVLRHAEKHEYYSPEETSSASERLSSLFMEHILTGELTPGTVIHETELKKLFKVSSTVVREFLIRFSRFGLIEKERNRHWTLRGFTREFADELFEVREMFEHKAFTSFLKDDQAGEAHQKLLALKPAHQSLLRHIKRDYLLFPRLDEKFHGVWIEHLGNRFVSDFFELISLVFHYHYRWNKKDEMERNKDALGEHLNIISAIELGHLREAERYFLEHLCRARETLMASVQWDVDR